MKQFKLALFNGHPIILDGANTILVDTGSPVTIHTEDYLQFCSKDYQCATDSMGLTASHISNLLGMEITTLLGVDILSDFKIMFDYKNEIIQFSTDDIEFAGTSIDISDFMHIPIIEMSIAQQNIKFFLDTGAKLSYLSKTLTDGYESIGREEDFYPGIGAFQTECYEIPTHFGAQSFVVKYGNLPALLQATLQIAGVDGIIGFDFFNNFKLLLDMKDQRLVYALL